MILNNKVAFVTGGSRGIGKAISISLAKAGAKVVLTYQKQKDSAEKVVSIIKDFGGSALVQQLDVCNRETVRNAMNECVNHYNKIDKKLFLL